LKAAPLNFVGTSKAGVFRRLDVVVCDGFIGNVALKLSEGLTEMFSTLLEGSLDASHFANRCAAFRKARNYKTRRLFGYGGALCWECAAS
jgi:glycerol-3-phosphate acyltransferase PlsX